MGSGVPESNIPFRSVAVLGPGLLGGSVLLALKQRFPEVELSAWARRPEARQEIRDLEIAVRVDETAAEAASGAGLVVLATPVPAMASVVEAAGEALNGSVVTDVGSVKARPAREVVEIVRKHGAEFVGSHPMAGSEKGGIAHASATLFDGAACIVTPDGDTDQEAVKQVVGFWEALRSRVSLLDPHEHDSIIARISHLPHTVASAVTMTALAKDPTIARFIGGGFRDTTRVAAGDADLWAGILDENAAEVAPLLRDLGSQLSEIAAILEAGDTEALRGFLDHARQLRQGCPSRIRD